MRNYPHRPNDAGLVEARSIDREEYEKYLAAAPNAEARQNGDLFDGIYEHAMYLAVLDYGLQEPVPHVRQWLEVACKAAEKAAQFGFHLDPFEYMDCLALANLCKRETFKRTLEGFKRKQFTNRNVLVDEIYYLAAEAMARLSAERTLDAQKTLEKAHKALQGPKKKGTVRPKNEPILNIEQAIVTGDELKLNEGLSAAVEQHAKDYSNALKRRDVTGLLDLLSLGLAQIATRARLHVTVKSVYLPLELIES
jgi:hypothetical protein